MCLIFLGTSGSEKNEMANQQRIVSGSHEGHVNADCPEFPSSCMTTPPLTDYVLQQLRS